jgi:hypothetical protein
MGDRDRVLGSCLLELAEDDLLRIESQTVCQEIAVGQDIGQFVADLIEVGIVIPLIVLEKLTRLDGDGLRQVRRGVELSPVAFLTELPLRLEHRVACHGPRLARPRTPAA